jgi:hypothetical protein
MQKVFIEIGMLLIAMKTLAQWTIRTESAYSSSSFFSPAGAFSGVVLGVVMLSR